MITLNTTIVPNIQGKDFLSQSLSLTDYSLWETVTGPLNFNQQIEFIKSRLENNIKESKTLSANIEFLKNKSMAFNGLSLSTTNISNFIDWENSNIAIDAFDGSIRPIIRHYTEVEGTISIDGNTIYSSSDITIVDSLKSITLSSLLDDKANYRGFYITGVDSYRLEPDPFSFSVKVGRGGIVIDGYGTRTLYFSGENSVIIYGVTFADVVYETVSKIQSSVLKLVKKIPNKIYLPSNVDWWFLHDIGKDGVGNDLWFKEVAIKDGSNKPYCHRIGNLLSTTSITSSEDSEEVVVDLNNGVILLEDKKIERSHWIIPESVKVYRNIYTWLLTDYSSGGTSMGNLQVGGNHFTGSTGISFTPTHETLLSKNIEYANIYNNEFLTAKAEVERLTAILNSNPLNARLANELEHLNAQLRYIPKFLPQRTEINVTSPTLRTTDPDSIRVGIIPAQVENPAWARITRRLAEIQSEMKNQQESDIYYRGYISAISFHMQKASEAEAKMKTLQESLSVSGDSVPLGPEQFDLMLFGSGENIEQDVVSILGLWSSVGQRLASEDEVKNLLKYKMGDVLLGIGHLGYEQFTNGYRSLIDYFISLGAIRPVNRITNAIAKSKGRLGTIFYSEVDNVFDIAIDSSIMVEPKINLKQGGNSFYEAINRSSEITSGSKKYSIFTIEIKTGDNPVYFETSLCGAKHQLMETPEEIKYYLQGILYDFSINNPGIVISPYRPAIAIDYDEWKFYLEKSRYFDFVGLKQDYDGSTWTSIIYLENPPGFYTYDAPCFISYIYRDEDPADIKSTEEHLYIRGIFTSDKKIPTRINHLQMEFKY